MEVIPMDMVGSIANLSVVMSQNRLASDVSTAMLDKTMDTWKEQGAEMVKMMESSVQPYLGQNINTYV